jgi:hypothetical protein
MPYPLFPEILFLPFCSRGQDNRWCYAQVEKPVPDCKKRKRRSLLFSLLDQVLVPFSRLSLVFEYMNKEERIIKNKRKKRLRDAAMKNKKNKRSGVIVKQMTMMQSPPKNQGTVHEDEEEH